MHGEIRPGYKQTEVGVIPEDWGHGLLDEFWTVIDCKHVTAPFIQIGFPLASIRETQARIVDLSEANQTTEVFYRKMIEGGRKPNPGDLIFSRNATVGEVAQVTDRHPLFAMGQDVCLLKKRREPYSTEFLQSFLKSSLTVRQIEDTMVGSTFKRVNVAQIKSLLVVMPDPSEQRAIAAALADADALIAALEGMIVKKRDLKQAAMQHLLTGKTRLPGFSGEWEVKRLGDVLSVRHGKSQKEVETAGGRYPIFATGGEIGRSDASLYDKPSVLIGRKGTIDEPRYVDTPFWTIDTLFYTEISARAVPLFIYYKFLTIDWRSYNEASGVPSLSSKTIEKIEIGCPDPIEQTAIAEVLSDMDADLAALEAQVAKARAVKQGMMQELLTGRVRLI